MPLVFSAFVPHPPIIVAGIGNPSDLDRVNKTRRSMSELAGVFRETKADLVVIISPHSQISSEAFLINTADPLDGSFAQFGRPDISFQLFGSTEESNEIYTFLSTKNIPIKIYRESYLDHGILVPLSFLTAGLKSQPIIPISYSNFSINQHLDLGRRLYDYFNSSKKRFALIASGDLSHRLTINAPAGYSPQGKEFDNQIIDLVQRRDYASITSLDTSLVDEAGECGYRSLCVLLGALDENPAVPKVLSYEGPFGVGYAVIHFPII